MRAYLLVAKVCDVTKSMRKIKLDIRVVDRGGYFILSGRYESFFVLLTRSKEPNILLENTFCSKFINLMQAIREHSSG